MSTRSYSAVRPVRPDDTELDGLGWVGWSDRRGIVRLDPDDTARRRFDEIESRPAEPTEEVATFWWAVFTFFMEGFALYGAALHPTAAVPVHTMLAARKDWQRLPDGCEPPERMQVSASDAAGRSGNVIELDRISPANAQRRWNWLRSVGETLVALPSQWRREHEIKRAVDTLMELDDRTLRDLGICGRADIERVVRSGRDC
ncbi:DUF1127 domain-containing protein [Bradyrhizobium commune]|uniref:DUF1127 domain-containing protein n=1 Tax=Bradyrhizobium commune TaxID=83627 RepID=A0A7S9GXX7_9BRAD|nr:DUF1127 domain-containing protein [Bradyrhizobium commune]QPF89908.1 DUF1127 domain-containing protein [Bradyrhizobium commune]